MGIGGVLLHLYGAKVIRLRRKRVTITAQKSHLYGVKDMPLRRKDDCLKNDGMMLVCKSLIDIRLQFCLRIANLKPKYFLFGKTLLMKGVL